MSKDSDKRLDDVQDKAGISKVNTTGIDLTMFNRSASLFKSLEDIKKRIGYADLVVNSGAAALLKNLEEAKKRINYVDLAVNSGAAAMLKNLENLNTRVGYADLAGKSGAAAMMKNLEDAKKRAGFVDLAGINSSAAMLKNLEEIRKKTWFSGLTEINGASEIIKNLENISRKAGFSDISRFDSIKGMLNETESLRNLYANNQELSNITKRRLTESCDLLREAYDKGRKVNEANDYLMSERSLNAQSIYETMEIGLAAIQGSFPTRHSEKEEQTAKKSIEDTDKGKNCTEQLHDAFLDKLKGFHPIIQVIIYVIMVKIVSAAALEFASGKVLLELNQAEAYVISLITDRPITRTDIIRENSEVDWNILNSFRFITGENVRLHVTPTVNSEVVEMIGKNTIVAVLGKKGRQWLFVQVQSGDELVTGWITRTYTKPLKN